MDRQEHLIDIVWAIVLIQGAITLLSFIEALVIGAAQGVALVPIMFLTGGGAVLALASARGLRKHRRWARRVTMVAESLVLVVGGLNLVATVILTQQIALMPLITAVLAPLAVIVLLRKTRPLFARPAAEALA